MNKKAFFAFLLATLLPVTGYLLVRYYSDRDVQMPRHYFYDSVVINNNNGKITSDTLWHKVRNLTFVNQLGDTVSLDSLRHKIIVIDFFFSSCPTMCPQLANSMSRLQNSFKNGNDSIVQFVSISIDPEHDSVPAMRAFADRYTKDHDTWWFVKTSKEEVNDFAFNELKASKFDPEIDTSSYHTDLFFLLDRDRIVRGFYRGRDSADQKRLVQDIPLLMLEKDKKRTFGQFVKELFERS